MHVLYRKSEPTAALRRWLFACVDTTDGKTPETGLSFTGAELQLSKAGAAFASFGGSVTELSDGLYYYEATAAELDTTGALTFKVEKTGVRLVILAPGYVVGEPPTQGVEPWVFACVDDTDGVTAEPSLTFAASELQLTLNGAAFQSHAGTVVELSDGAYHYTPTAGEKGTAGVIGFKVEKSGVRLGLYMVGQYRTSVHASTTTTVAQIRDRASDLITALTPTVMSNDRFLESRHEYKGDIRVWARANPHACRRRFSVRAVPLETVPEVSNVTTEQVRSTFETVVCYAQDHRDGEQGALDRDDVIDSDFRQIDKVIGLYSRANFPAGSAYDACWTGREFEIERDEGVDFLVLRNTYMFYQDRS